MAVPLQDILSSQNYAGSLFSLPDFTTAFLVLMLGSVVLAKGSLSRISVAFYLTTLTMGLWLVCFGVMYSAKTAEVALFWARLGYLGVALIPSTCYDFAIRVTSLEERYRQTSLLFWALSAFFLTTAIFSDRFIFSMRLYFWGYYPQYGPLGSLFLIFFSVVILLSLRVYFRSWRREDPNTLAEKRAKMFFIAFAIAYLSSIDFPAKYGLTIYPIGYLPIFFFCLLASWAILRMKLVPFTPAYAAKNIIDTMWEALFVLDDNGFIRLTNPAAARLLNQPEKEILGSTLHTYFSLPHGRQEIQRIVEVGSSNSFQIDGRGHDLAAKYFELSYSGLKDQAGKVTALICIVHDLTEQQLARQELEKVNRRLEERVQERTAELQTAHKRLLQTEKLCAVGKLSASIAHEFGSPIFAIRNLLESLRDNRAKANQSDDHSLLDLGIQECERLKKLLASLRDFYAPTAAAVSMVDLQQVIEEVLLFYRTRLQTNNITVNRNYHAGLPPLAVSADQFKQVVLNLLSNAEEAIRGAGTIDITTDCRDNQVILSFRDSGAGMDPTILDHIFEPFVTTKDKKIGTGLGLSITYGIIKGYGGDITVDSTPGQGTIFTLILPCSIRPPADLLADKSGFKTEKDP